MAGGRRDEMEAMGGYGCDGGRGNDGGDGMMIVMSTGTEPKTAVMEM